MPRKRDFNFDVRAVRAAQVRAAEKRLAAMDVSERIKIKTKKRVA